MFTEWLTSLPGLFTMSVGGIATGSMIGTIITAFNLAKKTKNLAELSAVLKDSTKTIKDRTIEIAKKDVDIFNKDAELIQKSSELAEANEINALLLRSMSSVVASSGIDAVTKLSLTNDLEAAKLRSIERAKMASDLIKQKSLENQETILAKTGLTVEEYNEKIRTQLEEQATVAKDSAAKEMLDAKNKATEIAQDKIAIAGEKGTEVLNKALDFINSTTEKYKKK